MRDALVTDPEGRLYGIVYREDLMRLLEQAGQHDHEQHTGSQGYPGS